MSLSISQSFSIPLFNVEAIRDLSSECCMNDMQHIREAALSHELGSGEQESFWVVGGDRNKAAFCRSEAGINEYSPSKWDE